MTAGETFFFFLITMGEFRKFDVLYYKYESKPGEFISYFKELLNIGEALTFVSISKFYNYYT